MKMSLKCQLKCGDLGNNVETFTENANIGPVSQNSLDLFEYNGRGQISKSQTSDFMALKYINYWDLGYK